MAVDYDDNFPSFFKIILQPRDDHLKLGIPNKFMTDYGSDDFSDFVSLKVPTGKTWKVKVLKKNGRAWFRDGWPEFTKHYSICHGHFLMFRYGGKSQFHVYIFDVTACEINYSLNLEQTRDIQGIRSETKTKINHASSPSTSENENGMAALVREHIRKFGNLITRKHIKKINSNRFKNPSFAVIMQPSYVTYQFMMNIPKTFAAEHIGNKGGIFTFQNLTGGTWLVNCTGKLAPQSKQHQGGWKKFSRGWKKFALDNNLRVGDICVFELTKAAKRLFIVEIISCSSGVAADDPRTPKLENGD